MRSLTCLALLVLAGTIAAADYAIGLKFEPNDWVLACDNTGSGRAADYQADAGDRDQTVTAGALSSATQAGSQCSTINWIASPPR